MFWQHDDVLSIKFIPIKHRQRIRPGRLWLARSQPNQKQDVIHEIQSKNGHSTFLNNLPFKRHLKLKVDPITVAEAPFYMFLICFLINRSLIRRSTDYYEREFALK